MKKKTIKRKNILSVLAVMIMLAATLLTACSSGKTAATQTKEEVTEVKEDTDEVEQVKEEVVEPEPTAELTPEPTPVPTPDMESTLPGVEWMQTFNGIIDEPKLVVFNDSTNKKIILEDKQEVEFFDDDTFAVYIPKDRGKIADDYFFEFEEVNYYDSVVTMKKMPSGIRRDGYSAAVYVAVEFDGIRKNLGCYLKLMGNP